MNELMNGALHQSLIGKFSVGWFVCLFGEILAKVERVAVSPGGINRQEDAGTSTNLLLLGFKV